MVSCNYLMKTIKEFTETFRNEQDCITFLIDLYGTKCRSCGHSETYRLKQNGWFKCKKCCKKSSVRINTIFQDSRLPLTTWFLGIFLLANAKKGMSSVEPGEKLGVTQKTAWFMYHRIRKTFGQPEMKFEGTVEIDETFVGGKEKNKHASMKKGKLPAKAPVIGVIERETSQVKASHIPNTKSITLHNYIFKNIKFGSEIMTDDNMAYRSINPCYKHKSVTHSIGEYVSGSVHTNSNIENFWSIFKRGYIGIYHYMSKKHLQRFVNEFVFRYNNRQDNKILLSMKNIAGKLSYKDLING